MITLGTDHPDDRVIGTIGRGNPGRTLAALAYIPGGDDVWWICRSDFVGLNLIASAKNKICSLAGRICGRRLTSQGTINA